MGNRDLSTEYAFRLLSSATLHNMTPSRRTPISYYSPGTTDMEAISSRTSTATSSATGVTSPGSTASDSPLLSPKRNSWVLDSESIRMRLECPENGEESPESLLEALDHVPQESHTTQSTPLKRRVSKCTPFPFSFSKTKEKRTLFSYIFHCIPKELVFNRELEYEYEKGTLLHEKILRIIFILVFSVTYTILELLEGEYLGEPLHYIFLGLEWLGAIGCIVATLVFPNNLLWQRSVSIVSILLQHIASLRSQTTTLLYRPIIVTLVSFVMFPFSAMLLLPFYAFAICALPIVGIVLDIHTQLIVQMWLVLVLVVLCSAISLLLLQIQNRRAFLSQYFLKLKKKEAHEEAQRMQFLIKQMLPQQLVKRLQEDLSLQSANAGLSPSKYQQLCEASIAFVRIKDFDTVAKGRSISETFIILSDLFSAFDHVVEESGLYRFKHVGQTYMFGGGAAFSQEKDHLQAVFKVSQEIILFLQSRKYLLDIVIGMASGQVVSGVMGNLSTRIHFDVWGNTVTLASRLTQFKSVKTTSRCGSCIHIESNLARRLDLSSFVVEKEDDVALKGRQEPIQILKIFPCNSARITDINCAQKNSPAGASRRFNVSMDTLKPFNACDLSTLPEHMQNTLLGSGQDSQSSVSLQRIRKYLSHSYTEKIEHVADIVPENLTVLGSEASFWRMLPVILLLPFRDWKFHRYFVNSSFRSGVTSDRAIILQCILLYCIAGLGNYSTMVLYSEREKLPFLLNMLESYAPFSQITWYSIGFWRYAIGLPIIGLSSVWVFTPLYYFPIGWYGYNIFTFVSSCGILFAHALSCHQLGSNLLDQFTLLIFAISFCNIHLFALTGKILLLLLAASIFIWQNLIEFAAISSARYQVSASLLLILIFFMCLHNSVLSRWNVAQSFLSNAFYACETKQLREKKVIGDTVACSVLPPTLVEKLKPGNRQYVTEFVESLSVCFADIVHFSQWSASLKPEELVKHLDCIFNKFSVLAEHRKLNRLHIVGDNFVCVSGCPNWLSDHEFQMVQYAFDILDFIKEYGEVEFRIGIHCGPALSGCLATSHLQWDILGPTMAIGELMEQTGKGMKIHISKSMYVALSHREDLLFEEYPHLIRDANLESDMETYFVTRKDKELEESVQVEDLNAQDIIICSK